MRAHLEERTKYPMLPSTMALKVEALFTLTTDDPVGGVDWTAATSCDVKATADTREFMNRKDNIAVDASFDIVLAEGIYLMVVHPVVRNTGAAANAAIAITNSDGTTVHAESEPVLVAATVGRAQCFVSAIVPVAANGTVVKIRGVASVASLTVADESCLGYITKIGNYGEHLS